MSVQNRDGALVDDWLDGRELRQLPHMTQRQAEGGHCTYGGAIASGTAVCQCGAWDAADFLPAERMTSRRAHLAQVFRMREAARGR